MGDFDVLLTAAQSVEASLMEAAAGLLPFQEPVLFRAAYAFEKATPWRERRPPDPV